MCAARKAAAAAAREKPVLAGEALQEARVKGASIGGKTAGRGRPKDKDNSPRYNVKGAIAGNSQEYLAARLARDAPAILTEWENGTIPSMRQAAIKAGIIRVPSKLAKYGTWEEFRSSVCGGTILPMIDNGQAFAKVKGAGPGIETIHDFLGKQWSRYLIENTLSVIKQEEDAERKKAEAWAKTSCGA